MICRKFVVAIGKHLQNVTDQRLLGDFVKSYGVLCEWNVEDVYNDPPTCATLCSKYFSIPGVQWDDLNFIVDIKYIGNKKLYELRNNSAVDAWANNLLQSYVEINKIERFFIYWQYNVAVYKSLAALKPPKVKSKQEENSIVKARYYSNNTLDELYTSVYLTAQKDPSQFWLGSNNGSNPAILKLNLENMLTLPKIVCVPRTSYSLVEMNAVRALVDYSGQFRDTAEESFTPADESPLLKCHINSFLLNISEEDKQRIEDLVNLAVQHLNVLTKSFHMTTCYNEATRRQIIDVFECYASAYTGVPCKVEATIPVETPSQDAYIGSG